MAEQGSKARRPRIDGLHNRALIVDAALRHFTEQGINASLEGIAKEAGVGPATLYRHFPTREALLADALYVRGEELLAGVTEIERSADPDCALQRWMRVMEDYLSLFQGLPDPVIRALPEQDSPLSAPCQRLIDVTDRLLKHAQRSGSARPEVQADGLFLSVLCLAWAKATGAADNATLETLRTMTAVGYLDQVRATGQ
ncbi:TetR/AcrR family transcriptional regulator [Streptomyces muensis]|uniref:TetR/AcrR family transcriptional regulator n=1 Tax=Streptomyces muensis TaxID=1077944 RepID=A0A9X1TT84_STRM4|nr:TetR/AcrR family transcriptional regulator [Streptomyces muensis]MCF1595213.1 TetR/AcrR family transcriptional regulator [Streptomyces muensis]